MKEKYAHITGRFSKRGVLLKYFTFGDKCSFSEGKNSLEKVNQVRKEPTFTKIGNLNENHLLLFKKLPLVNLKGTELCEETKRFLKTERLNLVN